MDDVRAPLTSIAAQFSPIAVILTGDGHRRKPPHQGARGTVISGSTGMRGRTRAAHPAQVAAALAQAPPRDQENLAQSSRKSCHRCRGSLSVAP